MTQADPLPIRGPLSPELPVFVLEVPGAESLNQSLLQTLRGMAEDVPTVGSNRADGVSYFDHKWLSEGRLHLLQDPDLDQLVTTTERAAAQLAGDVQSGRLLRVFAMWSIVSQPGMSGNRHAHNGAMSIAYYVDAGSSGVDDGGLIQFYKQRNDPQPHAQIQPASGRMLLFPSKLMHSVSHYQGEQPRIVISMNLAWKPTSEG